MMEEESAARLPTPQRDYSIALTTIPHIAKLILRNLEIRDLLSCKVICPLWEDIVNEFIKYKIYTLSQEITFRDTKNVIEKPQILLLHLKLPTDVQLIPGYSNIISEKCSLCCRPYHLRPIFDPKGYTTSSSRFYVASFHEEYDPKFDRKHLLDVAIFPTLPGVEMFRFKYHRIEEKKFARLGIKSVTEALELQKEDLKCVIWFSNKNLQDLITRNGNYTMVGVTNIHLEKWMHIGIAFCGSRVKAKSMNLYKNSIYDDLSVHPSFTEDYIQTLQKYKIDQSKCIAFVFSEYEKQCCDKHILFLFKRSFPDVPVIYYRCREFFGNECISSFRAYMPYDGYANDKAATLLLVWYD